MYKMTFLRKINVYKRLLYSSDVYP